VKAVPNPAEGVQGCVTITGQCRSVIYLLRALNCTVWLAMAGGIWRLSIARGLDEGAFKKISSKSRSESVTFKMKGPLCYC